MISTSCVVRKVQALVREFSNLNRYPGANRGKTFFKKEAGFMWKNWINCLIFFVKIKNIDIGWKQRTAFACAAKIVIFITTRKLLNI